MPRAMTAQITKLIDDDTTLARVNGVTVAAGYARGLLDYSVTRGASRDLLHADSGIHPSALTDHFNRIPLPRYIALRRSATRQLNDPAIALHFGQSIECADLSIISPITAACETVAEAFTMLNRYGRLALDVDGIDGPDHYKTARDGSGISMIDNRQHYGLCPEIPESSFTRMVTGIRRMYDPTMVRAVHFSHQAPPHRDMFAEVFGIPVTFGSAHTAILFDHTWFEQRIARSPRYSLAVLTAHADGLLRTLERSRSTRGRVEVALIPILHDGGASMQRVAETLAMSRPTLYRALRAEGTTFEQVLDGVRHRVALEELADGDTAVNEVALRLGFSEPAAFSRAFKRWTGHSPRQLRADTLRVVR